ncbi:MAG: hypothetical protein PHQ74_01585 [Crocinitomicaceae bacterium]|nr:hypothetical protein [Crocinitomicaceae bacterium]
MKISKLILSGIIASAMLSSTSAFATNNSPEFINKIVLSEDAEPTSMKIEELPEAVQQSIKVNAYTAERAFYMYKGDEKIYKVEVSKEGEKSVLYYHENGKSCDMSK